MGKGLGKIQTSIVDFLEAKSSPFTSLEITLAVHARINKQLSSESASISRAFFESVRRALKSLERKGLVIGLWHTSSGHKVWANRAVAISLVRSLTSSCGTSMFRKNAAVLELYHSEVSSRVNATEQTH